MEPEPTTELLLHEEQAVTNADPLVGSRIDGRFHLHSLLGVGTFGRVYKAKHLMLDQWVAVKLLERSLLDSEKALRRFEKEAALLSSFDHENIIKFWTYGISSDARAYLVTEYVDGSTLEALLKDETALHAERALPIFIQVCRGLAYAHSKGVIHRDIKPSNIMIRQADRAEGADGAESAELAKILDFGIHKSSDKSDQKLTDTGLFLGSARYMSPEQCSAAAVDARSDLYSLACLMYECLVGSAPFVDDNDLVVMQKQLYTPVTAVTARYGASADLQAIILKCLEKDPERRYKSADQVLQALESASLQNFKVPSLNHALPRRKLLAGLAIFCLLLTGLLGFVFLKQQNDDAGHGSKKKLSIKNLNRITRSLQSRSRLQVLPNNVSLVEMESWLTSQLEHSDASGLKPVLLFDERDQRNQVNSEPDLVDAYCLAQQEHFLRSIPGFCPGHKELIRRLEARRSKCSHDERMRLKTEYQLARVQALAGDSDGLASTIQGIEAEPCQDGELRGTELDYLYALLGNELQICGRFEEAIAACEKRAAVLKGRHEYDNQAVPLAMQCTESMWQRQLPRAETYARESVASLNNCFQNTKIVGVELFLQVAGLVERQQAGTIARLIEKYYRTDEDVACVLRSTNSSLSAEYILTKSIEVKLLHASVLRLCKRKADSLKLLFDDIEPQLVRLSQAGQSSTALVFEARFFDAVAHLRRPDLNSRLQPYLSEMKRQGSEQYSRSLLCLVAFLQQNHENADAYLTELQSKEQDGGMNPESRFLLAEALKNADRLPEAIAVLKKLVLSGEKSAVPREIQLLPRLKLVRLLVDDGDVSAALSVYQAAPSRELRRKCSSAAALFDDDVLHGELLYLSGQQKDGLALHEQLYQKYADCSVTALTGFSYFARVLAREYAEQKQYTKAISVLRQSVEKLQKFRAQIPPQQEVLGLLSEMKRLCSSAAENHELQWCLSQIKANNDLQALLLR